jgi:hypothetical protein
MLTWQMKYMYTNTKILIQGCSLWQNANTLRKKFIFNAKSLFYAKVLIYDTVHLDYDGSNYK